MLWIGATILGAIAQVYRNGLQASLTQKIGTLGATQVRFVFGLPFAALFLALACLISHEAIPRFTSKALLWGFAGALCQIGATALMLVTMKKRAFGVAYAYIKMEPVLVALLGLAVLREYPGPQGWLGIVISTCGVVIASLKPGDERQLLSDWRPVVAGLGAALLFGLAAICFRSGILALPAGSFLLRALALLAISMALQTVILGLWLALFDRAAFMGSLREWKSSFGAGFLGALASAGWFTGFSLTTAANVRTLGLIELPMAALLSGRFGDVVAHPREWAGIALILLGLLLLLTQAL